MRTNILILFCLLTVLFSCNKGETDSLERIIASKDENRVSEILMAPTLTSDKEISNEHMSKTEGLDNKPTIGKKKIIKDGNITIKAHDINITKKRIDNLLKKWNAYYESEDLQNNDQIISYNLKIRIPAINFEKFILGIENGKDDIESKNIQTRDVTEEYVDIETRLANKRDYLKRYKELLSKASTVKDILAIEENIRALQEEIESKEGRLNYLSDQVSFSTLNINLYKNKDTSQHQDSFLIRTKIAAKQGWTSIINFVLWTIGVWPYLLIISAAYFIFRRIFKKHQPKT